jgi:hypothetical protein
MCIHVFDRKDGKMGISLTTKEDIRLGRISPDQLFNKEAAAEFLGGVTSRTVTNLVTRGQLKPIKIANRTMFRFRDLCALARRGTK